MNSDKTRLIALVGPIAGERHVVQTANHPLAPDKMLPVADVVLLVSDDGGGAMVFRYTAHGEFGGDTLHASLATEPSRELRRLEPQMSENHSGSAVASARVIRRTCDPGQ